MSSKERTILVVGSTGQQGGAVARHLLTQGWLVRALTRDPSKPAARALAASGAEVVQGDLTDRASLDRVLQGVYGVFDMQISRLPEVGYGGEVQQGKNMADAAGAAGVQHYVYSSVGGADRNTGIPHFESKWEIERYISSLSLPATILRPVWFMDNLNRQRSAILQGSFSIPLRSDTVLQMVAVDDIGAFAALAFARPQEFIGKALELAGDSLTMPQTAEILSRVIGRPVRFVEQSLEQVRRFSAESALMYQWFMEDGYRADIPALRAIYPELTPLETWLRRTGWAQAKAA